jgi:nucleoside 2-deoxyribosyltransferase
MSKHKTAFFAFPAQPDDLSGTIMAAAEAACSTSSEISIKVWPELDIFGAAIADKVRTEIASADVLVADVTRPNLNVYYEIGFAIGAGKPFAPVINTAFADALTNLLEDGFFESIGHRRYENSEQLSKILLELPKLVLLDLYMKPTNFQQPLYVLDTYRKTDFRNAVVSAVKASDVFFRSFDPVETPRFATVPIIADVTSSAGIIVPLRYHMT